MMLSLMVSGCRLLLLIMAHEFPTYFLSMILLSLLKCWLSKWLLLSSVWIGFLFSANVLSMLANQISGEANILTIDDFGFYFSMHSINGRVTKHTFHHILDSVKKLAGWKSYTLSLAGRITLAQSVINTMPYYSMQTSKLHVSLCD